jgi:hypothetical protein
LGPLTGASEATREQIISSILHAGCHISTNVRLRPQFWISGSAAKGIVDYAIERIKIGEDGTVCAFEILCVTESKASDLNAGCAQNIFQLRSALEV